MEKIQFDLDSLDVQTFDTSSLPASLQPATVVAQSVQPDTSQYPCPTELWCETNWEVTCPGTYHGETCFNGACPTTANCTMNYCTFNYFTHCGPDCV